MPVDGHKPISLGGGWYYGLPNNDSPLAFEVYVLDPAQPAGAGGVRTQAIGGALGWMGDYALGTDLACHHVQPFPDDRLPTGSSQPPQERTEGILLGPKEIFRGGGLRWTYQRAVSVDLSAYPQGGDWHFGGEVDGRYPGLWDMFAGVGPTVIGFMPDPEFGMTDPEGNFAARFLGAPTETLKALEPAPTHTLAESMKLIGADFAIPLAGVTTGARYQLISGLDGKTFVFTASGLCMAAPPAWNAVAGTIKNGIWTTTVDFGAITPPSLGQTGWTVWSVVPIPACRPLPKGGYLVGATLYFAPWADNEWEERPGTRDATFMGTSNGWVPAKLGWDGPLNNDEHRPVYLTALDEWSVGRSLYGPDALLVYDAEGHFVKCLNSTALMPPDGREIMVTGEAWPRLIFRVYRHGTYSDFAEYNGQFINTGGNSEVQAPLYAVYDLLDSNGIGPGGFAGFVNMSEIQRYHTNDHLWRWGVANTLYAWDSPKSLWDPPGSAYVRSGRGGGGITILNPGPANSQSGIHGVGRNHA